MSEIMSYYDLTINIPAILISNGIGCTLILLLMISKKRQKLTVFFGEQYFNGMCWVCFFLCMAEALSSFLDKVSFPGARSIYIFCNSLFFASGSIFGYLWISYIACKLHLEKEKRVRKKVCRILPAVCICLLSVLNLFTDVFFGVNESNVYYRTPLSFLAYVVGYAYLSFGAYLVFTHRKTEKYLCMPVLLFMIPIYVGSVIQMLFYGITLIWTSAAIGITFLYIYLQDEKAYIDSLTKLYNRTFLNHYIEFFVDSAKKDQCIFGIMLDINNFKYINDTFGHLTGDRTLQLVAEALMKVIGKRGLVIRFGGDEFIILLKKIPYENVCMIKEEIKEQLLTYSMSGQAPCEITASIGIADFTETSVTEFLAEMDRKMYDEKRAYYVNKE